MQEQLPRRRGRREKHKIVQNQGRLPANKRRSAQTKTASEEAAID